MEMDARENEAKISTQLSTMAAPPSAAQPMRRSESLPRSMPMAAQTIRSVAAPKTQRQNSKSMIGRPDCTTNHPMVPEITMAAVISTVPRVLFFIASPFNVLRPRMPRDAGVVRSNSRMALQRGENEYFHFQVRVSLTMTASIAAASGIASISDRTARAGDWRTAEACRWWDSRPAHAGQDRTVFSRRRLIW